MDASKNPFKDFKTKVWVVFTVPFAVLPSVLDAVKDDKVTLNYILGNGAIYLITCALLAGCLVDLESFERDMHGKVDELTQIRLISIFVMVVSMFMYANVKREVRENGGPWIFAALLLAGAIVLGMAGYVVNSTRTLSATTPSNPAHD